MTKIAKIVSDNFYTYDETPEPILCHLHTIMPGKSESSHNCLGCNFAELIDGLKFNAELFDLKEGSVRVRGTNLLMSLYFILEGVELVLKLLGISGEDKNKLFPTLLKVRHWANFLKHPKAFFLSHHPEFIIEGEECTSKGIKINQEFIDQYYAGDKKNGELSRTLQNKDGSVVEFPNFATLLSEFSKELHSFMKLIQENPFFLDKLSNVSTFEKFFEENEWDEG